MTPASIRDLFYKEASQEFGLTVEEITLILRARDLSGFKPSKIEQYKQILRDEKAKRIAQEEEEIKQRLEEQFGQWTPPLCPICNARTYGDTKWYGRETKTEGWICAKGGLTHFLQWKANKIRRQQGLPIVFKEYDPDEK